LRGHNHGFKKSKGPKKTQRFFGHGRFQGKEPAVIITIKELPNAGLVWSSNPTGDTENRVGGVFWGRCCGWAGGASVVRTVDGDGEAEGTAVFAAMAYGGGRKGLLLSFLFPFFSFPFYAPNLLMPTILPLFSPFLWGDFFPLWFWF